MASELSREHPPMALLAGSVPCPLEAEVDRAAEAGWRFSQAPDVYAAAVRLLRTDRARPEAVLVLVESLRGDELRFFDLLARRWPDLPSAAVYCLCAEDRRLEACRVRNVTVLAAAGLADWLIAQHPVLQNPGQPAASTANSADPLAGRVRAPDTADDSSGATPAASPVPPVPSLADLGQAVPWRTASEGTGGTLPGATGSLPASASDQAPEPPTPDPVPAANLDVVLDLPDEWADLPDPEDSEAEPVPAREYDAADLPDESDDPEDRELRDQGEDLLPEGDETEDHEPDDAQDLPERVPLTPWSSVARPQRRKPDRIPPQNGGSGQRPAKPAQPPLPADSETGPSTPATGNAPAARPSGWEHGLLTPDELRALLQEPDETAGPQEAQP